MDTMVRRELWSAESKRSYAFHYQSACYNDIRYYCFKCKTLAVFSAEEQKRSFEIKKNYIWQRRTLCAPCNGELHRLRRQDRNCQVRWAADGAALACNRVFLREWLLVLQAIPLYSPNYRNGMSQRLAMLLQRAEEGAAPAPMAASGPGVACSRLHAAADRHHG